MKRQLTILLVLTAFVSFGQTWNTGQTKPSGATSLQALNNVTWYMNKPDTTLGANISGMGYYKIFNVDYFKKFRLFSDTTRLKGTFSNFKALGKQNKLTITTAGTTGPATLIGDTLNIPQYSGDSTNYVKVSPLSAQLGNIWMNGSGTFLGNLGTYIPLKIFGNLNAGDSWYGSILIGKEENNNQSAQFGWVYNQVTPSNSFAHITPYGTMEGGLFKMYQDGSLILGSLASTNQRLLSSSTDGTITPISNGNGIVKNNGSGSLSYINDAVQSLTGTTPTYNVDAGTDATITISGNTSFSMQNLIAGMSGTIYITNPATVYKIKFLGYNLNIAANLTYDANGITLKGLSIPQSFGWKYIGGVLFIHGTHYNSITY